MNSTHQRIAGLDGVRGVAVALVLGFHLYPRLVPGGWLGVSLFFTLSGFLITTVILRDLDNNTFTFTSFYARRVRRLVPAALLVLAVFTLSWTVLGWFDTNHRTDVFFSVLQVANWQQIWEGIPYGTALASPVVHYWSLAIEEQAYVVLPLLIVIAGAKRLRIIAVGLFGVSVAATFLANENQSVIYFGTHTRAAEILAGVIVAAYIHRRTWTPPRLTATVISAAGITYLIAVSLIVHLNDNIVYTGGLIVTGVISAAVIATIPHSSLTTLFNSAPLVWLGTVSYGIYLIHWPVLQTLKRTDLTQWVISPTTLIITLVLAAIMHTTFETPIRHAQFSIRKVSLLTTSLVVLFSSATFAKTPLLTFEDLADDDSIVSTTSPEKISLFILGDSRARTISQGVNKYFRESQSEEHLFHINRSFSDLGCPIGRGGRIDTKLGVFEISYKCDWTNLSAITSDIAIVWAGQWDSAPRDPKEIEGNDFLTFKDPRYRAWLKSEYRTLFATLRQSEQVKLIAVVNHNHIDGDTFPEDYNNFLNELRNEEDFVLLDLNTFISQVDLRYYLPDNRHVSIGKPTEYSPTTDNSAADLYKNWLEPVLCKAIRETDERILDGKICPTIEYSPRVKN